MLILKPSQTKSMRVHLPSLHVATWRTLSCVPTPSISGAARTPTFSPLCSSLGPDVRSAFIASTQRVELRLRPSLAYYALTCFR